MKNLSISAAILFAATLVACGAGAQAQGDKPAVVRLDPALDALVSPDARLQLVQGGFGFTEGLIWVEQGRYLLLSDIPANVIYKLTPGGKASIYMHRSGYTRPDIWRVGFEQTNGKNPSDPLFEKFYMIGSNGLALDRQAKATGEKTLAAMAKLAKARRVRFDSLCDRPNTVYDGIVRAARRKKCDAIFIASHGRSGLAKVVMGSVTQKVLVHSKIPVLVYR